MSIDIKEMRTDTAHAEETLANAATGAVVSMAGAAADPVGTTRRQIRRLSKQGEPVNRRISRRAERTAENIAETADDVVSGNLAERVALRGIRIVRNRARRRDMFGDVLYGGLSLLNSVLDGTARELNKFQDASQPPARGSEHRSSPARLSTSRRRTAAANRVTRATRRTTRSVATRTRRTARTA